MQKTNLRNNRFEQGLNKIKKHFRPVLKAWDAILIFLILVLMIEIFSFLLIKTVKVTHGGYYNPQVLNRGVYAGKEWAAAYLQEETASSDAEYSPYVGYKRKGEFKGSYINLDAKSIRYTENTCKKNGYLKIFVFGGSTVWGTGARDNKTIPSLMSKIFCEEGIAVEVTNFGEGGYTNTQEMIQLILELRKGNIPDYVVFYDGANDVIAAFQNNEAGLPQNLENRRIEFNSRNKLNLVRPLYYETNTGRVIQEIVRYLPKKQTAPANNENLDREVLQVYFENIKIIDMLSEKYRFKAFYFWQPDINTKESLSDDERLVAKDAPAVRLFLETHALLRNNLTSIISYTELKPVHFHNIDDVFSAHNESIYRDAFHVSEEGNGIIAKAITEILLEDIRRGGSVKK